MNVILLEEKALNADLILTPVIPGVMPRLDLEEPAARDCAKRDPAAIAISLSAEWVKVLARSRLDEPIYATPAILDNTLCNRTAGTLYAFGK